MVLPEGTWKKEEKEKQKVNGPDLITSIFEEECTEKCACGAYLTKAGDHIFVDPVYETPERLTLIHNRVMILVYGSAKDPAKEWEFDLFDSDSITKIRDLIKTI